MSEIPVTEEELASLRQDCWNNALYCWGTAVIFERRGRRLGRLLRILNFIGIGVPLAVGGIVLSISAKQSVVQVLTKVAGPLLALQLIWSGWALAAKWDDRREYAIESMGDNFRLANSYADTAQYPPSDIKHRIEVLGVQNANRETQDTRQYLKPREKRRGMRAGLSRYQRSCVACGKVPESPEKATRCETCGRFGLLWFLRRKGNGNG